jgi:hypothetical protein
MQERYQPNTRNLNTECVDKVKTHSFCILSEKGIVWVYLPKFGVMCHLLGVDIYKLKLIDVVKPNLSVDIVVLIRIKLFEKRIYSGKTCVDTYNESEC